MALAAFAALVPTTCSRLTPGGILNVHPSLLPRWRGAAPIRRRCWRATPETGVSASSAWSRRSTPGRFCSRSACRSRPRTTTCRSSRAWPRSGRELLVRALREQPDARAAGRRRRRRTASRIERDDARIDWSQPAETIWNQVRAYRGWPQAFTTFDGRQLKVCARGPLDASCGTTRAPVRVPRSDGGRWWLPAMRLAAPGRSAARRQRAQ